MVYTDTLGQQKTTQPEQPDERKNIQMSRISSTYADRSDNEKPIVMVVHGSGFSREEWDMLLGHLPFPHRTVTLDLCGHGESDIAHSGTTFDEMAEDIKALADHLELVRPILIGHSLGGMLALHLLGKYPDWMGGAVLLEGWTSLTELDWKARGQMYGNLSNGVRESIEKKSARTFGRWPGDSHDRFWQSVLAADGYSALLSSTCPILEIYGDRGQSRPTPEQLRVPQKNNIDILWIRGAGHYLLHENSELIGQAVSEWIKIYR